MSVTKTGTEMTLLARLLTAIFPDMAGEEKADIMELRGKKENAHEIDPSSIADEAIEEMIAKGDQEDVKDERGFRVLPDLRLSH